MEYETPIRICTILIEATASGAAVYWIVSPYIHPYEKGKKFMVSFLLIEFVHRVFRAWCYLRVPEKIWMAEYLLYYICILGAFLLFLRGNPAKHLINIWGPAFLFDLYGTIFMVGGLLLLEGGDFEKVVYLMDFTDKKSIVLFLVSCVTGAYFIRKLVEIMERTKVRWMGVFKMILALMGIYSKSKANCGIALFGIPAFVIILLLNVHFQSRGYKEVRKGYEALENQKKKYDDKTAELYAIKQDALKYLDEGCKAGESEYEKEIVGRFDKVLENENG